MTDGPIRVVVVDDDDLLRAGLRSVLASDPTIDVVGEAVDGHAGVRSAAILRPDVVLMDVRMPGLDGIAATVGVLEASPSTKVIMLTTFEHDDYIFGGLRAGASGFLLKRTRAEELITAIHTVAEGDALLSPSVTRRVIADIAGRANPPRVADSRLVEPLTPREREVLCLIAKGLSNGEIADELVVEESTIKSHVKRIFQKVGARDRVQAVIFAYETGLTDAVAGP